MKGETGNLGMMNRGINEESGTGKNCKRKNMETASFTAFYVFLHAAAVNNIHHVKIAFCLRVGKSSNKSNIDFKQNLELGHSQTKLQN